MSLTVGFQWRLRLAGFDFNVQILMLYLIMISWISLWSVQFALNGMFSLIYTFFFNFYIDHIFQFFQWSRDVSSFPSSSVSNRSLLKYEFHCAITTSKHVIKSHLGIMIHSLVYFRKNFILQFENLNPNLNKFAMVWIIILWLFLQGFQ